MTRAQERRAEFGLTAAVAVALLLPVVAAASGGVIAEVRAAEVVFGGSTQIDARLGAIIHEPTIDMGTPSFYLQAQRGQAVTAVAAGKTIGGLSTYDERSFEEKVGLDDTRLRSADVRGQFYVGVFPLQEATLTFESLGGSITPNSNPPAEAHVFVPSDMDMPRQAIGGSVLWKPSAGPLRATISGSFAVVLWEIDVALNESGPLLRSGTFSKPSDAMLPPATTPAASDQEDRQLFLFVEAGTLTFETSSPESFTVVLVAPRTATLGEVRFLGAEARVADGDGLTEPTRGDLVVAGDISTETNAEPTTVIPLLVSGRPNQVSLNGHVVPWAAPVSVNAPGGFTWWPLLMVGLVAVPGAVAGRVYGRRWIDARRMGFLEDMVEMGNWDSVAQRAPKLATSAHFGFDASVIRVDALIRLGRLDEALDVATSLRAPSEMTAPVMDFTLAYLYAARGDTARAVQHALACIKADTSFAQYVLDFPEFATIRSDPLLRPALPSKASGSNLAGYA